MNIRALFLLFPLAAGFEACRSGGLAMKLAVPLGCALILVVGDAPIRQHRDVAWVLLAFAASMIGDTFLSTRAGRESFYLAGIAAFFVAHAGYLGFALRNGRIHRILLTLLLAGYLAWFVVQLGPAISSVALRYAALAYLLISCVAWSAAAGLRLPPAAKGAYVAGIGLIVFSDTLIALKDFLKVSDPSFLILPTYYLAQILITWAVVMRGVPPKPGGTPEFASG
ncbi:MAG: hypothetical protein JNK85_24855 [Verrucomicrobiales bacterium]|nr:hypothetical protein [Verrucomicrobiales bacterium]